MRFSSDATWMPPALPAAAVPARFVPIQLPSMTLLPAPSSEMPDPVQRLITRPRTVLPPPAIRRPCATPATFAPLSSMIGAPDQPGWEVPSITTGAEIVGSADSGAIVVAPLAMLNVIVLGPMPEFASTIAWRRDPGPASLVLLTSNPPLALGVVHAENSEVLPCGFVAVAVMTSPARRGATPNAKLPLPAASVVTDPEPR